VSQNIESLPTLFQIQSIKAVIDLMKGKVEFLVYKSFRNYPGEMLEKMDEVMAKARANRQTKRY